MNKTSKETERLIITSLLSNLQLANHNMHRMEFKLAVSQLQKARRALEKIETYDRQQ